ncbi:hypothetical protein M422DRAFT_34642, partial [Sphaerobolus stellatus SS14]
SESEGMPRKREVQKRRRIQKLPRLQKDVLKCSIAYLIASLFTFVPDGGPSGGHMLATLYVLFASFRLVTNVSQYPMLEPVCVSDIIVFRIGTIETNLNAIGPASPNHRGSF